MNQFQSETLQLSVDVSVGGILAGKYRVDRILGRGGMGVVVAATHLELGTPVALKFLLPEVRSSQEVVARFAREARAAAQIKSEYVARTLDVGKLDNGSPYIVMEYLDGSDLAQRLAERGPLPIADAVRLILQACDALAEAHSLGIIHRDLKPSNLFVTRRRDGTEIAKLLDFGISKLTATGGTGPDLGMTRTSSVMGSPLYMSPEQLVAARNVDLRTDIWALGVTLYEALAGVPPFNGESMPELCTRVMTQSPPPLVTLRRDVPPQLEAVIMRCLEKDPSARYATAADFTAALRPFAPVSTTDIGHRPSAELLVPAVLGVAGATGSRSELPHALPTINSWGKTNDTQIPKKAFWLPLSIVVGGGLAVAATLVVWKLRAPDAATLSAASSSVQGTSIPTGQTSELAAPAGSELITSAASSVTVTPASAPTASGRKSETALVTRAAPALAPVGANRQVAKKLGPTDRSPAGAATGAVNGRVGAGRRDGDLFGDRN